MVMAMPAIRVDNATSRRIPQLAVRQKAPTAEALPASNDTVRQRSWETNPRPTSSKRVSVSNGSDKDTRRGDPKHNQASDKKQTGKRRSTGVLGFLTLKEPSTSALEEFAEQERRKLANQKGSKVLPGVSSQKLPDHVPKVNSKWDGMPEPSKRKDKERLSRDKTNRSSTKSVDSRHSAGSDRSQGHSARPALGSLSSKPLSRRSQEHKRSVSISFTDAADSPIREAKSSSVMPSTEAQIHPAFRTNQRVFLDEHGAGTNLSPTTPPGLEESQGKMDGDLSSGAEEGSPQTPEFDFGTTSVQELDPSDVNGAFWIAKGDTVAGNVGGPTPSARTTPGYVRNFSHVSKYLPRDPSASSEQAYDTSTMPTIRRASLAPQNVYSDAASSSSDRSIPTLASTVEEEHPIVAPPIAPASVASTKRKDDVLPWETFEPPTTMAVEGKKQNRFSTRLGRK